MKPHVAPAHRAIFTWRGIPIRIAASADGIISLQPAAPHSPIIEDQPWPATPSAASTHPWFRQALACLDDPRLAQPPLDPRGTPFQRAVWSALRAIPPGHTCHYAAIAATIGRPSAARAVAAACAANPIAILIPCHRVLRRDGSLAGFRWGLELKKFLLKTERSTPSEKKSSKMQKRV